MFRNSPNDIKGIAMKKTRRKLSQEFEKVVIMHGIECDKAMKGIAGIFNCVLPFSNALVSKLNEAEDKKKRVLTITDLMKLISEIGKLLNSVCKGCPKREEVGKKILDINIEDAEYEESVA